MAEFSDFLIRVLETLKNTQLKYVVVGGIAAIIRGRARTTADLDLIVENDKEKLPFFFQQLQTANFEVMDEQMHYALEEGHNLSIFDQKSAMRIDLKVAKKSDDLEVLKDAENFVYQKMDMKIAPVNWILYGKIVYLGEINDEDESELLELNDVMDFITIYNLYKDKVNLDWIQQKVGKKLKSTIDLLINLSHKKKK